jgi:CheY-like chemotaxis protein
MMPKMDGMEATGLIRDLGYNHPVVAMTANAVAGSAERFLSNGFDGFISKPVDIRELNSSLNRFVRDKQPIEVIEAARKEMNRKKKASDSDPSKNILKNETMVEAVLRDIANAINVLSELLAEKDYLSDTDMDLYTTTVHGMKSALFNIGEKELSTNAYELEKAGERRELAVVLKNTPPFINRLKALTRKIKPEEAGSPVELSNANMTLLRDKLIEIKTACGRIKKSDAKAALDDLKHKDWPREIVVLLDEISDYLLLGKFKLVVAAIDKVSDNLDKKH